MGTLARNWLIVRQSYQYIETSQLICGAYDGNSDVNELRVLLHILCKTDFQHPDWFCCPRTRDIQTVTLKHSAKKNYKKEII